MSISCVKTDCFGNRFGRCNVLSEAFEKECPFYKTVEQHDEDLAKKNQRLARLGIQEAFEKAYKTRDRRKP